MKMLEMCNLSRTEACSGPKDYSASWQCTFCSFSSPFLFRLTASSTMIFCLCFMKMLEMCNLSRTEAYTGLKVTQLVGSARSARCSQFLLRLTAPSPQTMIFCFCFMKMLVTWNLSRTEPYTEPKGYSASRQCLFCSFSSPFLFRLTAPSNYDILCYEDAWDVESLPNGSVHRTKGLLS